MHGEREMETGYCWIKLEEPHGRFRSSGGDNIKIDVKELEWQDVDSIPLTVDMETGEFL